MPSVDRAKVMLRCMLTLHFLPWPEKTGLGGDLESPASPLLGSAGPVWPQWAFLASMGLSLSGFSLPSCENPQPWRKSETGLGEGQGGFPEPSWAMLSPCAHPFLAGLVVGPSAGWGLGLPPVQPSWPRLFVPFAVRSTFSALSQHWHLEFPGMPTSPKVPPSKSSLCPPGDR